MKKLMAFVMLFSLMSASSFASIGFDRAINGSSSVCKGVTKTYSLMLFPPGDVDWQVSGGAVIISEDMFEVQIKFLYEGTVTLKAVISTGDVYTKSIRVNGNPTLSIRQAPVFPMNNEYEFIASVSGSSGGSYYWDAGPNQVDANGRNATVYFDTPHVVRCTFYGSCGSASAEIMPKLFMLME